MNKLAFRLGLFALCLMTAACPPRAAMWLRPGSTGDDLSFVFSSHRLGSDTIDMYFLRTNRCGTPAPVRSDSMLQVAAEEPEPFRIWEIRTTDGPRPLREVKYGTVPLGFHSIVSTPPLSDSLPPGCYTAFTDNAGIEFHVLADNRAIEIAK